MLSEPIKQIDICKLSQFNESVFRWKLSVEKNFFTRYLSLKLSHRANLTRLKKANFYISL